MRKRTSQCRFYYHTARAKASDGSARRFQVTILTCGTSVQKITNWYFPFFTASAPMVNHKQLGKTYCQIISEDKWGWGSILNRPLLLADTKPTTKTHRPHILPLPLPENCKIGARWPRRVEISRAFPKRRQGNNHQSQGLSSTKLFVVLFSLFLYFCVRLFGYRCLFSVSKKF